MLRYIPLCFLLILGGCASAPTYNPVQSAVSQTFVLNEPALKSLKTGMAQTEVHRIMGDTIIVGYAYQEPFAGEQSMAKPITITNPYRSTPVRTAQGDCTVEYYVTAIRHPDGVVSDDELMPLTFCNGILTAKGASPKP